MDASALQDRLLVRVPTACELLDIRRSTFYKKVFPHVRTMQLARNGPTLVEVDSLRQFIKTYAAQSESAA